MKKLLVITFFVIIAAVDTVFAQGFQPPTEGKAVVYFTRVTLYGKPVEFEFFHQDKYIGAFKGDEYIRYECDPGTQLFWASSENKEFLTAELEEGKIYIVMVDVIMGVMKAHVGLTPVTIDKVEDVHKVKLLVAKKAASNTPEAKIEKMNKKLSEKFIPKQLEMYESTWKTERNYKHLSAEMAIPIESLQ
jgi:hypothetical protein